MVIAFQSDARPTQRTAGLTKARLLGYSRVLALLGVSVLGAFTAHDVSVYEGE